MATILRRRNRLVLVLTVAAALLAPIVAAQAQPSRESGGPVQHASAAGTAHQHKPKKPKPPKPPQPGPKPPPVGAPPPAPTDISGSMPRTMRDDLTGDFRGLGYDQRMRAEDNGLNIYDSAARDGGLLYSTTLDLHIAPDHLDGGQTPWAANAYKSGGSAACAGCMQKFWSYYHLSTIYLARNNESLFITGTQGTDVDGYRNYLYVAPPDGSCASASCATSKTELPHYFPSDADGTRARTITATSLAAGYVAGHAYLAVGLSDTGVQIYDVSNPRSPKLTATFAGMATDDGSQTPVTALAWDPAGSGLLAVGVISWADRAYMVHVGADGTVASWQASEAGATRGSVEPVVMSAAIGRGPTGEPVAAFGTDWDNKLQIFDNPTGATRLITPTSASGGGRGTIVAINPIPRVDGTSGGDDFAVSYQPSSDILNGSGELWRWDGTSGPLTAQPMSLGPNNTPNTVVPDRGTFRTWYPGIKEGRFDVQNTSDEPISVHLHTKPDGEYGCWYAPSWADAPAFPSQDGTQEVTLAAGQTSDTYTMGAYTAGLTGECGDATDVEGSWRGYLAVAPVNRPADVTLVDVQLDRHLNVDVTADHVGDSTTVSITKDDQSGGAFGLWTITVGTPKAPSAQTAPTVTGTRLTAPPVGAEPDQGQADDPHRPVYRFDVTGAQWSGIDPAKQLTALVPAMTAEGSTDDGTTWTTDLGKLMPTTQPTVTNGTVTLGEASFYWQADPGEQPLTDVRVISGGLASNVVHLADLVAPPTNGGPKAVPVGSLSLTSATANPTAGPRANGVDQAPLSVALQPSNTGGVIPANDPRYGLVYYRDFNSNELITGLYTAGDYNDYLSITPWRGAYPNDGLNAGLLGSSKTAASTIPTASATTNSCMHQPHSMSPESSCPPCRKHGHHERNMHCSGGSGGGSGGSGGGLGSGVPSQVHAYLSTTSGLSQSLIGVLNDSGTAGAAIPGGTSGVFTSSSLSVKGSTTSITANGSALSLTGCPSDPCTLGSPTAAAPGLYQAADLKRGATADPVIGLMFAMQATNAENDLPLQMATNQTTHKLGESVINFANNTPSLDTSKFWKSDRIDTSLITAGQLVRVTGAQ